MPHQDRIPEPATLAADDIQSIDELDAAIRKLARQMNMETYRMLVLVREFDDRMGWQKWSTRNCAEWLAWRCDLSLSAAREKVRTAHALREMPAIAAAFADGSLSYSKVRALTRVVEYHDEESLLAYALEVSAEQVEERCREIRNASPERSGAGAWRAWEHRSLIVSRDPARGMLKITVEMPIEDGEVVVNAIERVADAGDAAIGLEFAAARKLDSVRDSAEQGAANGWRAQRADALLAIAKASLAGARVVAGDDSDSTDDSASGEADAVPVTGTSVADHYQLIVHVDDSALRGGLGRSDLPIDTVRRLACDGSVITVVEDERGAPLDVGRKQRVVSTPLRRALLVARSPLHVPGLLEQALRRCPSHPSLGRRRRDEPREPHAALLASSSRAARGAVPDPARCRRRDLLSEAGWARDSEGGLPARGHPR